MDDKEDYLISMLESQYIGDDGAVVGEYIYSVDAFCEGIHFRRKWMNPYQIGRKAMLVNISDAVAMNASVMYALVSLSIPKNMENEDIKKLLDGMSSEAKKWGFEIIGGDTVGGDKLNISITLISQSDDPLPRVGLKEGDLLAYTGELGESIEGLHLLETGEVLVDNHRFYAPTLRAAFIAKARPYLNAGMDISDGLFCDTNKLLEANKYGVEILIDIAERKGMSGEEYEMLIGFDPKYKEHIEKIATNTTTQLTIFGRVSQNTERLKCLSHHFG